MLASHFLITINDSEPAFDFLPCAPVGQGVWASPRSGFAAVGGRARDGLSAERHLRQRDDAHAGRLEALSGGARDATPLGSSPCTHSVSRRTFSRLPWRETISSFSTMWTTRSLTTSGSWSTAPGTLREVKLPSSS
jgi:hypothetical protein